MKKTVAGALLTGAVLGALVAGNAMAADMPVKAPLLKAPAPVYNWTGCYINAGAGYGLWDQKAVLEGFGPQDWTVGGKGFFGTVGAGCDYQLSSSWVIGVLGDYDFGDIKGQFPLPSPFDSTNFFGDESEKWAWSVGGRIGYLLTPTILTYVSGGYTEAHFDQVGFVPFGGTIVEGLLAAHTYHGYYIGSGFDYAVNFLPVQGLFLRSEYRFTTTEDDDVPFLSTNGRPDGTFLNSRKYIQTVRTSLVWRFNWH